MRLGQAAMEALRAEITGCLKPGDELVADYRLGFHVALYYSYATNSGDVLTYSINNINNFGIRVGISF